MGRAIVNLEDLSFADLKAMESEVSIQRAMSDGEKWGEWNEKFNLVRDEINLRIDSIGK